jgi:hypothetical protein
LHASISLRQQDTGHQHLLLHIHSATAGTHHMHTVIPLLFFDLQGARKMTSVLRVLIPVGEATIPSSEGAPRLPLCSGSMLQPPPPIVSHRPASFYLIAPCSPLARQRVLVREFLFLTHSVAKT